MRKQIFVLLALLVLPSPFASAQPVPCAESNGKGVVACVEAAHPDKLAAGVSLEQRQENMRFLRDRVIETARCKLIDVGLNCKRGNCNNISLDFIAWKNGDRVEGVDIGARYDDLSRPLSLMWHTYEPPNYGHPTFKEYGRGISCVTGRPPPVTPSPAPPAVDVEQLRAEVAELKAKIADLHSALWNELEHALAERIGVERNERQKADAELGALVMEIGSRPIPTTCAARGPFGIPVRCEIR